MFDKVLIANRGEIALRILRACRQLGLQTVVVYSKADRHAQYVSLADQAVCIGAGPAQSSYLRHSAILGAAIATGAQAIHPGYGFLSENASFVSRVHDLGLTFIGPSAQAIRTMGDKIAAKQAMRAAGVPCVPGSADAVDEHTDLDALVREVGFPMLIKAAGGGGGKGMRTVFQREDLERAIALTREEARKAFGNAAVYAERYLSAPRHIEFQMLCDSTGNAVCLGTRDCSMQRRHQKVLEEAPAGGIDAAQIDAMIEVCRRACVSIGYVGAGTLEFLYENGEFFFIEMNTRLQVEHPVTEAISGIDIVRDQIAVAMGTPLPYRQEDVRVAGHAIECRINAEDPKTFLASPGRITGLRLPGGIGVRVDSYVTQGDAVSPYYDSMIAKVICSGATRSEAIARMRQAIDEMQVEGIHTTLPLHRALLRDASVQAGATDIHYLESWLAQQTTETPA